MVFDGGDGSRPPSPPPPSPASILAATVLPIVAVYALKMAAYWAIQGAAAGLPTATVAAHQPVWAAWNLAAFALTPLEAAALAFVPAARSAREAAALARVILVRCGGVLGLAGGAAAAAAAAWGGAVFSHDASLWPLMRSVAPQSGLATLACAADVAATGILVAAKAPRVVVVSMTGALAAVLAWRLGVIARAPVSARLGLVWWCLTLFFVARAAGSVGGLYKVGLLSRRRETGEGGEAAAGGVR
jgi:hypothetical protein